MKLIRTTLRIDEKLKKQAELIALKENTTFQEIVNIALRDSLTKRAEKRAGKYIIPKLNLGIPLDNLTRDDIYSEPAV